MNAENYAYGAEYIRDSEVLVTSGIKGSYYDDAISEAGGLVVEILVYP